MAVAIDTHSAPEFELVIAQEAALGTPNTTAADFQRLDQKENSSPDLSGFVDDDTPRMDGTNIPQAGDRFFTVAGSTILQPFNTVATKATLDLFLYGVMQDLVSEGATTPFEKIWEWDDATDHGNFAAHAGVTDPGIFFTVVGKNPIASEDTIITSAFIPNMTITSDPGTNSGKLTLTGNFLSGFPSTGKFDPRGSQSIAGATEPGTDFFHHCKLKTKTLGGVDLIVASWNIALNNKGARVGCDVDGDAENYAIGNNKYEAIGSMKLMYDANTKGIIDNYMTSGFDTQLVFAYGSGNDPVDTDGDLLFKFNVGLGQPVKDFVAVEGTMIDVPIICRGDGTNEMVEIELANIVDRGWTA